LICGADSQQHFQMSCGFTSFNKQTCKNRYEQSVLGFQKQGEATKVFTPAGKKLPRGLKLLRETLGTGNAAQSGDRVTIRFKMTLNRGDCVTEYERYSFTMGQRDVVAAIELTVAGMKTGGCRVVKASPDLAYRETGVEGSIPRNTVIVLTVALIDIFPNTLQSCGANNTLNELKDYCWLI